MKSSGLAFVSFEPKGDRFISFISMEGLVSLETDPEVTLQKAARLYEYSMTKMRSLVAKIQVLRAEHKPIPARTIWQLGDNIFELTEGMGQLALQIDGLYDHLVRDLCVKRKWLEKVIILRRYIPSERVIPESLNWGHFEKGTRQVAQRLLNSLPNG